jgi:integrase
MVLAATTGMRRSELAGAGRELLDLDAATLEVQEHFSIQARLPADLP